LTPKRTVHRFPGVAVGRSTGNSSNTLTGGDVVDQFVRGTELTVVRREKSPDINDGGPYLGTAASIVAISKSDSPANQVMQEAVE
jgi:hypothetical protein